MASMDEPDPGLIGDDDLQRSLVGELKPHNAPIVLVDYDPEWPSLFAREAHRIRAVLSDTALRVEMLRFRDWLRVHDVDRDSYAQCKRDLAGRSWRHVQHYATAKTAVIQEIMNRANAAS
jgi:GrpB-like predicted nucleotidyltransferase (UPF0157 family)